MTPSLKERLSVLSRDQLEDMLITLVNENPSIEPRIQHIMHEYEHEQKSPPHLPATLSRHTTIDTSPYRHRVQAVLRAAPSMLSELDTEYYTSCIIEGIKNIADDACAYINNGDGNNALILLNAVTEEFAPIWSELDNADGEADIYLDELGMLWAEALLTADVTAEERQHWHEKFVAWQQKLSTYGMDYIFQIAQLAALEGWDDPILQRVLHGDTDAWSEHDQSTAKQETWTPDTYLHSTGNRKNLIQIRLGILEQQQRHEEFLYLAQAAGNMFQYITKLAEVGRAKEALKISLGHFTEAYQSLALAKTMHKHGETDKAMRVAELGLLLHAPHKALATWLCDLATEQGNTALALRAAQVAFKEVCTLPTYLTVQDLAGDAWPTIRTELLEHVRQYDTNISDKADIFLHEALIDDAIALVESDLYNYSLLDRVLEAAIPQRPNWVISRGSRAAEQPVAEGKSQYYHYAVNRLSLVKQAYQQLDKVADWIGYLQDLKQRYGRKRTFISMLQRL